MAKWILTGLLIVFHLSVMAQFVTVKGKEFIGPDGKPLFLKGVNLGNWLLPEGYMFKFEKATSPRKIEEVITELIGPEAAEKFWKAFMDSYIIELDIQQIKKLGFNSVRVPFNSRLVMNESGPATINEAFFLRMNKLLTWCEKAGLYVIFDMHGAPGGQTGDNIDDSWGYPYLFTSPDMQERAIRIWEEFAKRYANRSIIIGYDLLNEPLAHYFNADSLNHTLEPLYRRMTDTIRRYDKNHIIFLGGAQWNSNFSVFGPPFDDKLAYTFHKYWTPTDVSVIQDYLDFSKKYNVPLWMGESGENSDEWVMAFRKTLEANNVPWCFWPYKKMDDTAGPVQFKKPENWDLIVKYADGDRSTFKAIRENRPDRQVVIKTLQQYILNMRAEVCTVNEGYMKALGLMP
ncbi:MAG: cellulase family glycosylhydrolase [Bacteroidetes bacterium]|nr:cellulase family glycosylhydrolase [Bacteroidota bacterium]